MDDSSGVETSFSSSSQSPQAAECQKDTFTVVLPAPEDGRENTPLMENGKLTGAKLLLNKSKRRRDWKSIILLIVLWFVVLFIGAAYSMIAPFFPEQAEKKGSSLLVVGLIISSSPFCVFVTSPIFGYLLPKIGIKFSILSGMLLVGGPFMVMGFLEDIPSGWAFITTAFLLRMIEGVGSSLTLTAVNTLLPEIFPNNIGLVTGWFEVGSAMGFAIGPPIGGVLYTVGGFKVPFISMGCTVLVLIPPVFLLFKRTSCQSKVMSLRVILKLSSNFVFLLLLLGQVLSLAALGFQNPTFQPYLDEQFGLNELQVGLVFIGAPAMYMLLALLFGGLADKYLHKRMPIETISNEGPRGFIICGFVVSGISYFLIGPAHFIATPRLWLTIAAFVLFGAGYAAAFVPTYPDLLNIARSQHPEEDTKVITGVVSGLASSTLSFGEFIGPLMGAVITDLTDFQTSSMLLGQVLIAQAVLLLGVTMIDKCYVNRSKKALA